MFPSDGRRRESAGFSLMELMVVVVILGLLLTIVIRNVRNRVPQARVATVKAQMREFENALDDYKLDSGQYPSSEQGLDALVNQPTSGTIPRNYPKEGYIKRIPKDPWGNEYIYVLQNIGSDQYVIISHGRDGREGGEGEDKDLINTKIYEE